MKTEDLSLDDFDAADTADMTVMRADGSPSTWDSTFAGPGHPKAVELSNKLSRERLARDREQEQARVNGKKWKADTETPDELAQRNADYIIDRLLGWSSVSFGGEPFPFTVENARKILLDPRKNIAVQALEFLSEQRSFTKASAKR
jgi:hypothetical protein